MHACVCKDWEGPSNTCLPPNGLAKFITLFHTVYWYRRTDDKEQTSGSGWHTKVLHT